jgi:predicted  nucleic acid-binding Zn-ribbon protein
VIDGVRQSGALVFLTIRETDPDDFDPGTITVTPFTPTPPTPVVPAPMVVDLAVTAATRTYSDDRRRAVLRATWATVPATATAVIVQVRVLGQSETESITAEVSALSVEWEAVPGVTYEVRARYVSEERETSWGAWLPVVADDVRTGPGDFDQAVWDVVQSDATTVADLALADFEIEKLDPPVSEIRRQEADLEAIADMVLWLQDRAHATAARFTDAGIYVDPGSGLVRIDGVDQADGKISAAEIRLDAVEADISLRATTAYVDNAVTNAILDPTQIPALNSLELRVDSAEVNISALQSSVSAKADSLVVDGLDVRLTTAESLVSANAAAILDRVQVSDFTALETRVTTAETEISAFDGATFTRVLSDIREVARDVDVAVETLADLITDYEQREAIRSDLAIVGQELRAQVTSDREAVAQSVTTLAAAIDANAAQIVAEQTARADADSALASDITQLQADLSSAESDVAGNASALTSLSTQVANVNGTVSSQASQITALETSVGDNTTSITQVQSSVDGISAEYGVKINSNGHVSGFGLLGGGGTSQFFIQADTFKVISADGTRFNTPFSVYTSSRTVNGVVVPAGTYIENAVIADLSAQVSTIGTLRTRTTGARVEITDDVIRIYDSNNNLRVKLGDLS